VAERRPFLSRALRVIEETWLFHVVNAAVAAVWLRDGILAYRRYRDYGEVASLLLCAMNALLVLFYLSRRRSHDVEARFKVVVLATLGTWGSLLYEAGEPLVPALDRPCLVVMSVMLVVSLGGYLSLGRSWGIIPANRGVRTGGFYRVVRHPIYASYIVFDAVYALDQASWRNAAVALMIALVLYSRACYEEELLRRDPEYAAYASRTRYMLFPRVV
jgi:protein-S-isoprenylcysteine O-methyltransferase Ste14